MITREAALSKRGGKTKTLYVSQWEDMARIRTWVWTERDLFYAKSKDGINASAWLVAQLVIDEDGAPVFKPEDVIELEKQFPAAIDQIVLAILELNKSGEKAVEEAAKN